MAKKSAGKKSQDKKLPRKSKKNKPAKNKALKTKAPSTGLVLEAVPQTRTETLLQHDAEGSLPLKVMKPSSELKTDAAGWRKLVSDANSSSQNPDHEISQIVANTTSENPPANISDTSIRHLENASTFLAIATGIAILLGAVMVFLPGGYDAVPAMGGVLNATVPIQTAQVSFLLDILFPITFGAGFALLANAFQTRGNRPVVRMILTALLFAVLADFSENALVFKALTGAETHAVQWPLTVIKYATLGLAAVLLSSVMLKRGLLGDICLIFLRYVFPVSVAILVAGIGGRIGSDLVGASFPVGLLLLAIYALTLSRYGKSI